MDFVAVLAREFSLRPEQVRAVIELLDAGNTVPFIARYRKEATGSLDDQLLRELTERLEYLRSLDKRRMEIEKSLAEQQVLTDEFLEEVRAKGQYLRDRIEALNLPCLGKTRGLGLMIGIEVKDGYSNGEVANRLVEAGLLVLTAGAGLRLLPPLVITKEEMDAGVAIMAKTLAE